MRPTMRLKIPSQINSQFLLKFLKHKERKIKVCNILLMVTKQNFFEGRFDKGLIVNFNHKECFSNCTLLDKDCWFYAVTILNFLFYLEK